MSRVKPYDPIDWDLPIAWYCPADGRLVETTINEKYAHEKGWHAVWVPAVIDADNLFQDDGVTVHLDGKVGAQPHKKPFEFATGQVRWLLVNMPGAAEQAEEDRREQQRQAEENPLFAMWA